MPSTPPGGLNAVTAVKIARAHLQFPDIATIWGWESGPWEFIDPEYRFDRYEQPLSDAADPDDRVWAVVFQSPIEISPPSGGDVSHREALVTVFLAHETGDWLSTSTWGPSRASEIPPAMYGSEPIELPHELSITNNTTLTVNLDVNGHLLTFAPGGHDLELDASELGPPPWHVVARTPSGRPLLKLDFRPGDAWRTEVGPRGNSAASGAAVRAELSCGRLDIWSGPPMLGPMPPPSFPPNDCDP